MPHDIRALRVEFLDDGRCCVVCKCGWRSPTSDTAADALAVWQDLHQDDAIVTEHGFAAVFKVDEDLYEARCRCGWICHSSSIDCLDYLKIHVRDSMP